MNPTLRVPFLLFVLLAAGFSATPGGRTDAAPMVQAHAEVIADLAEELQREHLAGTFDGLVLVAHDNSVLFKQAYGCADRQSGIRNSAATISDMGSIAKTFTAAAVLHLVQGERLQLSDTIGDFYPGADQQVRSITIEQLLGHSSGLDNFHNDSDFELMDKAEAERRILAMPLMAVPGERIAYSNAAYTLLAAIVEQASGQSFQDYVHENLLGPLQLTNTGFYRDTHLPETHLARGYGGDDQGSTTFGKGLTWALVGAGGMVSSVDDLASWFYALEQGALFSDQAANPVYTQANERWLLGSFSQIEINGEPVIQMGGSTDFGYTALIQSVANRDLLIVLLLNGHDRKYANASHHRLSRNHMLPTLLREKDE